jgi:hypothetical protein
MINIFPCLPITILLCYIYIYIYIYIYCRSLPKPHNRKFSFLGTEIMNSSISVLLFFLLGLALLISASALPGVASDVLKIHTLSETSPFEDCLSFSYYQQKCPDAEAIINRKLKQWFQKDYTLAASLIRLHFHDCSVRVRMFSIGSVLYIYI